MPGRRLIPLVAAILLLVHGVAASVGDPASVALRAASDHDAPQHVEDWADLSDWTAAGVTAADGRLHSAAVAEDAGAVRPLPADPEGDVRVRGQIHLVPGGTDGLTAIGVTVAPPDAPPAATHLVAIGFTAAGQPALYRGTEAGGTGVTVLDPSPQEAAAYSVTVTTDDVGLMLTMTDGDGSREWRAAVRRDELGAPVGQVAVWNSDPRGSGGSAVGPVGYRESAAPLDGELPLGGGAPSATWGWGDGGAQHVALPAGYEPGRPVPLVIYAHGSQGGELSVFDPHMVDVYTALLDAGYAVASSSQHGDNWGNVRSVLDLRALYEYVDSRYPVSEVFLLGHSMGGLSSLWLAALQTLPVAAWAGIYPVTDLRAMWNGGVPHHRSAMRAAYGAEEAEGFTARMRAAEPGRLPPEAFAELPMRFYASFDDTLVPARTHSAALVRMLSAHEVDAELVEHAGDHGDASAFRPDDLVAFFDRSR